MSDDEPERRKHRADPESDNPAQWPRKQRVAHIVGLMRDDKFRRGVTFKELAEKWDLSDDYLRVLTSEAARIVRKTVTDPDALAAEVVPGLLTAFHAAVDAVDPRGAAAVGNLLADIGGFKAPKRSELTGKDGGPIETRGPGIFLPPESDD